MRRLLLVVIVCLVAIPTALLASEKQLDGSWKLTAVAAQDVRVEVPPEMDVVVDFDRAKHTWTLRAKLQNDTHEATGTWRMQGKRLYLAFKGQEAPPVDVTVTESELQMVMSLPEGQRYTVIAKRVTSPKARPLPPPLPTGKPRPGNPGGGPPPKPPTK